jgi:hypothetical protein
VRDGTVYYGCHRAQWLEKIRDAGVRRRAEQLYQQLGMLQQLRRDLKTPLHIGDPMRKASVLMWLFWYLFWMAERFLPKDCVPVDSRFHRN